VHQVTYSCKLHCQLSRADRPDRLADALHVLDGNSGGRRMDMDMVLAAKTPEYRLAPPLYPSSSSSSADAPPCSPGVPALPPSGQLLETIREVRALAALNHPNIINYYGVTLEPRVCVVLELLHCSLAQALSTPASEAAVALEGAQRLLVIRDVCLGLQYMHEQCFAHLDLKPHNVLLSAANGGYSAKLADFGTAVQLADGEVLTRPVGTSGYTAPEISMPGRYDLRADIFSFAVVAWELLVHDGSGRPPAPNPFAGKDLDEAACDAHGGVRPSLQPSRLPALNDAVAQAWATSPDARLPLADMLRALDQAQAQQ
jgi:serine/threonine protein kinase